MEEQDNPLTEVAKPLLIYGTAFKGGDTGTFTAQALANGFLALDSANFPASYMEPMTGDAIAAAIRSGVDRSTLFIQTKFTPAWAYGKNMMPFNPCESIETQIRTSIRQSLYHLKIDYLDALLLHAPYQDDATTLIAWAVLETFVPHTIRTLGVSNFPLPRLQALYNSAARVRPTAVQNTFSRQKGYQIPLRAFCRDRGITFQAFHTLRRNPELLASTIVEKVSEKLGVEKELALYVLVLGLGGIQILDGTTNVERMVQDTTKINQVFDHKDPSLLHALQPDIGNFRELLLELAG
ncbi:aldo-keto reductase [Ophiostoma piceae UAMH 11346]|uniref:Aldo-keto reductase n=1 Tax=Ophiostoma piceae (strain UAMH 11346) TaxID=1262450 RepID=S3CSJ0_OPHP1|nr:aldo-keto reductase [Ophiostoma piceae UAMH 11346]